MQLIRKATGLLLGATVLSTVFITEAQAVPAFARQTGMACVSCHANNFPALNAFGRSFKANGYTMRGAAPLVEGDDLSIPADLKASVISKLRFELAGNVDGGRGEIQWPDEAALLIGGRAAENIGFLFEAGMGPQEGEGHADTGTGTISGDTNGNGIMDAGETWVADTGTGATATEVSGNFLSYKAQFNVSDNFGVVVFGTDGLGVGYGMELMNTGLQRSQRPIENRKGYSAGQRLGTASGTATGLAFVYHTGNLMVNYSHWGPSWGNAHANIFGGLAHYLRVNYFMNVAGWDMGFGANMMSGKMKTGATDAELHELHVASSGVDFQALGTLGSMPAEFYFSYGEAPKGTANAPEVYNSSIDSNHTAFGLLGKLGVAPKTSVYVAYGSTSTSANVDDETDTTIGLQYMLAQNSKLEIYNVSNSTTNDAKDYTMFMLFSGF